MLLLLTFWSFLIVSHQIFLGPLGVFHQGDPLSSYFFIIMAEGLGRLIKSHISQNQIQRCQWENSLPTHSHLQFVDDMALAGRAKI